MCFERYCKNAVPATPIHVKVASKDKSHIREEIV